MECKIQKLFDEISNEYSLIILNWAYKKLGNREQAEDLAQEVFLQVFSAITKQIMEGKEVVKLDHLLWKIAHYVWCHYLRQGEKVKQMVSIDELQLSDESDFTNSYSDEEDKRVLIRNLRDKISRLNYLQREIMISFYIEELSIQQIADKFHMKNSAVKWHLFDTRKKLKKEIKNMDNVEYVYRPRVLNMAISGNCLPNPDTDRIGQNLMMQNICIACYYESKTLDELNNMLGIPKVYIEHDLQWLVEREFIEEKSGKYTTIFMIDTVEYEQGKYEVYLHHKKNLLDVIVSELIASEKKIRDVGFYGADKPMSHLLWMLIYQFASFVEVPYVDIEAPIRPDGGRYFPLGFDRTDYAVNSKVIDKKNWSYNGPKEYDNFQWFGLYNFGSSDIQQLISGYSKKWSNLKELFIKIIKEEVSIQNMNKEEQYMLSELVEKGFVTIQNEKLCPNLYIFTKEQYDLLKNEIFTPIKEIIKDEFSKFVLDIKSYCRNKIPPHLMGQADLYVKMALYDLGYVTTICAFNDGKLYEPIDSIDGGRLTFLYCKENS